MRIWRIIAASVLAASGLAIVTAAPAVAAAATVSDFTQCANGSGSALTCVGGWINGALGTSNAHFSEDQVVPQRALIALPADSDEHTLTFTYQDRKGSIHAYDSLATWNTTVTGADPCQGLSASLCAGSPSTLPMTSDPATNVPPAAAGLSTAVVDHELAQARRQWVMYGGVLTSDAVIGHSSPTAGDDLVTVTVRFRNADPSTASTAVLLFGGHLAVGGPNDAPRAWGVNRGASSVSGGPYAFKLESVDGGSTGAKANSIQASAAAPLQPAAFTIQKTADPATAAPGSTVDYTVTVANTGGLAGSTTFTDDFADSISPSSVTTTPSGGTCTATTSGNRVLQCTTGTLAAGDSQEFSYSATMPTSFSGGAGTAGCVPDAFPITNTATLTGGNTATGAGPSSATVCIDAAADFSVTKTVDDPTPSAGDTVTYTVTVTNNGSAPGSTTATDEFDSRLTPSVPDGCSVDGSTMTCMTDTLAPGEHQSFVYSAALPTTFSGESGAGSCDPGSYLVANTVNAGSASDSADVCVSAAPHFTVSKDADDLTAEPGQVITYTITVGNDGTANGSTSLIDDYDNRLHPSVPAGCTDDGDVLTCATEDIPAGEHTTFTYTATMPATFSGSTGSCADGSYPVANSATLPSGTSDDVTVCVGAAADFTIEKSVDNDAPAPGDTVHYTVTVTNGGAAAGSTTFTDDYADGMTVGTLPAGDPTGTCTEAAGSFSCDTGEVPGGGSVTFTYSATVPATFGADAGSADCPAGSYALGNSATLADGPAADVTLCVAAAPDFAIDKVVDDADAAPGAIVHYTVTVINNGDAAGATTFTDDFDDRVSPSVVAAMPTGGSCAYAGDTDLVLDCTTAVIPAGGQQTFEYDVQLPATFDGAAGGGSCDPGTYEVRNVATLAGGGSDGATVCSPAAPGFTVDKGVDNVSPEPGDTVTYTITVTNTGNAAGATSFVDDFDDRLAPSDAVSSPEGNDCASVGGSFSCTTGTIPGLGGQQTFTYTATMPTTFTGAGGGGSCAPGSYRVANTVTLDGGATDAVDVCVSAAPDFSVTKTVDQDHVAPGNAVSYTITVTNGGDASGATTFTDDYDNRLTPTVPDGCAAADGELTCTTDTIASGGTQSFVYTATVPDTFTGTAGGGTCGPDEYRITNDVVVEGGTHAGVDVCVTAVPDFTITKTADDTTVGTGDTVTYTLTVTNTGSAPGSTSFSDDFDDRVAPSTATSAPAGNDCAPSTIWPNAAFLCTSGTIDPGESQTFTYTAAMPDSFGEGASTTGCADGRYAVANVAQVGDVTDSVTVCVAAAPAFSIDKSADDTAVGPDDPVTYTVTVTNTGDAAGSTSFVDDFDNRLSPTAPDGCTMSDGTFECTTAVLDPGESQDFTYDATMPSTFSGTPDGDSCEPPAYPVGNTATLTGGGSDTVTVCVGASPDLVVAKSVDPADAVPGQTVTYTLTVTNNGTAPGSTTLTDDFDDRLDPSVPDGCTVDEGVLTCPTGSIAAGDTATISYTAELPDSYTGAAATGGCDTGYPVSNGVSLPNGSSASATVCVDAAPDFRVTKEIDDAHPAPGQLVTYTVTVRNVGSAPGSTSFTDDYDDRLVPSAVASDTVGAACSAADGVLSCSTGTIEAGSAQVFTYTATMPVSFSGTSETGDCAVGEYAVANRVDLGDEHADAVACVAAAPDFAVDKVADTQIATPGQAVTYTLTVRNDGTASGSTPVSDDFDDRLDVVAPDGCSIADGVLRCDVTDLAAGDQTQITYTATLPATFSGDTGTNGCAPDTYAVLNDVTVDGDTGHAVVCVDADAAFTVTKVADPAVADPGESVHYTVTVTNSGDAAGSTGFVDDFDNRLDPTVPAGCDLVDGTLECTTGTIAGGGGTEVFEYDATMPLTYGTHVGESGCGDGQFAVRNTVTTDEGPGAGATVCVSAAPHLLVDKSVDDESPEPGQMLTYTITVTNDGNAAASTTVTDTWGDDLLDVTVPDGCTATSGGFTCEVTDLAAGDHVDLTYTGVVPTTFSGESGGDGCPTGSYPVANSVFLTQLLAPARVVACVDAAPAFGIDKVADPAAATPGATVTYTVTVSNTGDAGGSTSFTDDYDNRLDPSVPAGCTDDGDVLTCTTDTIAAGDEEQFTYTATVPTTFSGEDGQGGCADGTYRIGNTATIDGGAAASAEVCVAAAPEFTVTKDATPRDVSPGDTVHYVVTVSNDGDASGATSFTDDYDNRLSPTVPDGCTAGDGVLACTTGVIAAGASQAFEYDAVLPATYSGEDGTNGCGPGTYAVRNDVLFGDDVVAGHTVCVPAAPEFTIAKASDTGVAQPGQEVSWTVTVGNTGSLAGSTTFTDTYDARLVPTVPDGCTAADGTLTCTTGVIDPGDEVGFSYSASLPATYTGPSGLGSCADGTFPVGNTAMLADGGTASTTTCVAAAPDVSLVKESALDSTDDGDQLLTYTITWRNDGSAEALDVVVRDAVPTFTGFVSCTDGCAVGGDPAVATWSVGDVATGESGSVTLVVKVTSNTTCQVTNTAQVSVDGGPAIDSNTVENAVSPQPDPDGAHAYGSAVGVQAKTSGLLNLGAILDGLLLTNHATVTAVSAASEQDGVGTALDHDELLDLSLPANGSLLRTGVVTTTSASSVTRAPAEARQTSTSEVAGVCLVPVGGVCTVQTDTVRAVASTMANGRYAAGSSAGSTIQNLRVVGLGTPVDLNQTTKIPLNALVFGKNSYVAINERNLSARGSGTSYVADMSVTMIHVKITGVLLGVQAADIVVGQAVAHSDFPKTYTCGTGSQLVSGHAYVAQLTTGPLLADLLQGFVQISPFGGDESEQIASVQLPANDSVIGLQAADSRSHGGLTATTSAAESHAEIAGNGEGPLCVIGLGSTCVVTAAAVRSEVSSLANADGSTSSDAGSKLVGLSLLGIPVTAQPPPNKTIKLPGIGFIILNEQFCDNGTEAAHSCSGLGHSGMTVRAARVVITVANNVLGLTPGVELILAEAHADSTFK